MTSSSESPVTRAEQKQVTRQKLLDTTIDLISEVGLGGVTMAKVAERAGLSRGICNFHFCTKEQLMLEAFRMLYQEHRQAWMQALAEPNLPPAQRVSRLVEVLLSPPIADHKKLAVWLAFWGVAPHRQTYLELCTESDREYEEAVEGVLLELSGGHAEVNGMSLRAIAMALTSMIDGAHVQYLIAPGRLNVNEAISACTAYLASFFPEFRCCLRS